MPPLVIDLATLTAAQGFVINGIDANDRSGRSVASAGDVNGDGIDDLIIGAPGGDPGGRLYAGESYVVFGKQGGFGTSLELSSLNGTTGFVINGIAGGDYSGFSVASAGDVNGDGIDDLIIGANDANSRTGESYVVFGSRTGFGASLDLSSLNGANGFVLGGIDAFDLSGRSVASAGDVNGDGLGDLIIGAPRADVFTGESYVVFGSSTGFAASIHLASLNGGNGFRIDGIDGFDQSGTSVASAGDVNGDGIDDVIIGARSAGPGGRGSAGESHVVFGTRAGFAASLNLSSLDGTNGFVINGIAASDRSGFSVASAGDVNGDGIADLIIGAYGANNLTGESYVVFGTRAGFGASFELSTLNGTNGFAISGIDADDRSGFSVASAGDVNGDGLGDLIIGAAYVNSKRGESYVVFGKTGGFGPRLDLSNLNATDGLVLRGIDGDDLSGRSVASAGDVNGDGLGDLIIGAYRADPGGRSYAGESYVIFGTDTTAPTLSGDFQFTVDQGRSVVLTTADFAGADVVSGAAALTYAVSGPVSGFVALTSAPNVAITSFTQAQLAGGQVLFQHDGVAPGFSGFSFVLRDAAGNATEPRAVLGTAIADTTAPTLTGDFSLTLPEGGSLILTTADFSASDAVSGAGQLTYTVVGPVNGIVALRSDNTVAITSFTQAQLAAEEVVFVHDGSETLEGNFSVFVTDAAGNRSEQRAVLGSVFPINDPLGEVNDADAAGNTVAENAAIGAEVGVTALALDPDVGALVVYGLTNDAGGRFAINSTTGVVTVAGALDFESATSHQISVIAVGNDLFIRTASFTIAVTNADDPLGAVTDANAAGNAVAENAGVGTQVGLTALALDPDAGDTVSYALTDSAGGRFAIDAGTGVVTVAGPLDFETASSHQITVQATSSGGGSQTANFTIAVTNADDPLGAVADVNAAGNSVAGNAAIGTAVGLIARAVDPDAGDTVTYSLTDDAGGRFAINASTGVVTVAGPLGFTGATSHQITVQATSTGGGSQTASFTIAVTEPPRVIELATLSAAQGFVINGIDAFDYSGRSVASAGDVNGDGIDDLIIGVYFGDPGGRFNAGESYVVFGRNAERDGGFALNLDLNSLDGSNGFVINGRAENDRSGFSVASAGDVNGDGVGDLIIGANQASPGGRALAGESYVVFGKTGGFGASLELSSLNGTNGFVLGGMDVFDFSGFSVASAGDVNGDGIDDVIIGAYLADPGGRGGAGESYVVFGTATGFGASLDLSDLNGANGFVLNGIGENDFSGRSVASAGDVNGDGIDDLIIGAYRANGGAGDSYVVFGKTGGFGANLELSNLNGTNGFVINGIDAFDRSGISVASAGDVNGDGIDDLIIGADRADPGGRSSAGESYVVFGTATGFGASLNLSGLNGANGFVINGIDVYDESGRSVASAGDVNGDGIDDLIIGADRADPGGRFAAGASYVVFGSSTGFGASVDLSSLSATTGFVINGIDGGDKSGHSVASAGDVNGDGIDDLIIGAYLADPGGRFAAGASYVIFGTDSFAPTILSDLRVEMERGQSVVFTTADLLASDAVSGAGELTYTVASLLNGFVALTSAPTVAISSFTQAQVSAGQVLFQHDGSDTTSGDVSLVLRDAAGNSPGQFAVLGAVSPDRTAPTILSDLRVEMERGQSVVFTTADLLASDAVSGAGDLTYTVASLLNGFVALTSAPTVAISSFTQAQVSAGQVLFQHDGSDTTSGDVSLVLRDAAGNSPGPFAVLGAVSPDTTAPTLSGDFNIAMAEGGSVVLTTADFSASDAVSGAGQLTYTVVGPVNGIVALASAPAVAIASFTQEQLAAGEVVFVHDGSETLEGNFSFIVTDAAGQAAGQRAVLGAVAPTDDPLGAVRDVNAAGNTVAENAGVGTQVGVTALALDPDTGDTVTYSLTDSAGGRFAIDPTTGVVTVAGPLDFETARSHSITVQATSSGGDSQSAAFVIQVTDIAERLAITGTAGRDRLLGSAADEAFFARAGVDNMTGRGGNDLFVFGAETRNSLRETDTITDFRAGDLLDLGGAAILREVNSGGSTRLVLDGDGDTIVLTGLRDFTPDMLFV